MARPFCIARKRASRFNWAMASVLPEEPALPLFTTCAPMTWQMAGRAHRWSRSIIRHLLAGWISCPKPCRPCRRWSLSTLAAFPTSPYVGSAGELIAFDSGPGNALIDQWVQTVGGIPFDQDGTIASEGGIIGSIVDHYLAESFFEKTAPKSLDRNDFLPLDTGAAHRLEDGARSLARVSAEAILKSCDHLPEPPKLWIVCGGGRKNPAIMADLKTLAHAKIRGGSCHG